MDLNGITLKYATAQPLCKMMDAQGENIRIFFQSIKAAPEFCLDAANISKIESANGKTKLLNDRWIISALQPGTSCIISITGKNGVKQKILVLSQAQALQAWILKNHTKKYFLLSGETLYLDGDELNIIGPHNKQEVSILAGSTLINGAKPPVIDGIFTSYENTLPGKNLQPDFRQVQLLDEAQWLKTSVDYIDERNKLYHKLFYKEFNLGNPSTIKSAIIYLAAPTYCRLQVNNVWVSQSIDTGRLSPMDITGYVKKGDNTLMMDFPFEKGNRSFAAKVMVEYFNTDEISFTTDTSWRMAEQYYFPAPLGTFANFFSTPVVTQRPVSFNDSYRGFTEYKINIPCNYSEGLNNLYLSTQYTGIRAELRLHHKLVADNYNNNTNWNVDLDRNGSQLECRSLVLKLFPLQAHDKVLFDLPPAASDIGKSVINKIGFIPEYKTVFKLRTETR